MPTAKQYDLDLSGMLSRQSKVEAQIDALTKDVSAVTHSIGQLADIVRQGNKTPWNNIIGAVAVAFTILSAIFGILISQQATTAARLEATISRMSDKQESSVGERFKAFDIILQREMRLLDEVASARSTAIDERIAVRLDQTMERLRSVESWQRENNVSNTASVAALTVKVEDLERRIRDSAPVR